MFLFNWNKNNLLATLFWILTMSLFLVSRFWFLDSIPKGLNWDEASYAYNAYALSQSGADEWGTPHPVYLRAFGDYKPALLSYCMALAFSLFGASDIVVRGTVGVIAGLGLLGLYFFIKKVSSEIEAKLVLLFCVLSPMHTHFSRIAMDPIIGFSLAMCGLCLIVQKKLISQLLGLLVLFGSMYTYHAEKFTVPVVVIVLAFIGNNYIHRRKLIGIGITAITISLFGYSLLFHTNQRIVNVFNLNKPEYANSVNETIYRSNISGIVNQRLLNNKLWHIIPLLCKNYFLHFQPDFLFFDNNIGSRQAFSKYGNLLLVTFPFIVIGLIHFFRHGQLPMVGVLFLVWLLISPIPATFTSDVPHAGRVLFILPALGYFFSRGVIYIQQKWKNIKTLLLYSLLGLLLFTNYLVYFRDYYLYFPEDSYVSFQGYMLPLSNLISQNMSSYSNVVLNNITINSYIFYSWYQKIDPRIIQQKHQSGNVSEIHELSQLTFLSIDDQDLYCNLLRPNTLIISSSSFSEANTSISHTSFETYNRFHPSEKLFDIYDTNKLEASLSAISKARCNR